MPSGPSVDDLPLPVLGDRLAAQLEKLHDLAGGPVDVVAESEEASVSTRCSTATLAWPVGSIVLLSPIVAPGQLSYPPGADGASVSEDALDELNNLVGSMSPYGPSGAQQLLSSVSEFGARYFEAVADPSGEPALPARGGPARRRAHAAGLARRRAWSLLAFHGGLLGDGGVLPMVSAFLTGRPVTAQNEGELRDAAEAISSAAIAWRMPVAHSMCPGNKVF